MALEDGLIIGQEAKPTVALEDTIVALQDTIMALEDTIVAREDNLTLEKSAPAAQPKLTP